MAHPIRRDHRLLAGKRIPPARAGEETLGPAANAARAKGKDIYARCCDSPRFETDGRPHPGVLVLGVVPGPLHDHKPVVIILADPVNDFAGANRAVRDASMAATSSRAGRWHPAKVSVRVSTDSSRAGIREQGRQRIGCGRADHGEVRRGRVTAAPSSGRGAAVSQAEDAPHFPGARSDIRSRSAA